MPRRKQPNEPAPPRRKACTACSDAKVRCDQRRDGCTRCEKRRLACIYPAPITRPHYHNLQSGSETDIHPQLVENGIVSSTATGTFSPHLLNSSYRVSSPLASGFPQSDGDALICDMDTSAIQARWLKPFLQDELDKPKSLPRGTSSYIGRMLKSYTDSIINNSSRPPFIHSTQTQKDTICLPLANCFALLRVLSSGIEGSNVLSVQLLEDEMGRLFAQYQMYDEYTMLAACQAYLIYSMTLFFHLEHGQSSDLLRQPLMNLQQMAGACVSQGIATNAEKRRIRPSWKSWMLVEAKRRTLYTMYLFDNYLCDVDGLQSVVASELKGLLAPCSKFLWQSKGGDEWENSYNCQISATNGDFLRIDELWALPNDASREVRSLRQKRIDTWLESVDEYGAMLFAVTIAIHGP